jgi:hypothetical protein
MGAAARATGALITSATITAVSKTIMLFIVFVSLLWPFASAHTIGVGEEVMHPGKYPASATSRRG